jgi:hypothetical protein
MSLAWPSFCAAEGLLFPGGLLGLGCWARQQGAYLQRLPRRLGERSDAEGAQNHLRFVLGIWCILGNLNVLHRVDLVCHHLRSRTEKLQVRSSASR